jgi:uncharacterized membrane protein YraQ (UPF0718 family)
MVNEVAIVLLWGLFGWKIAVIYMGTGLLVAIIAGMIIGKLNLEKWVEEYVYKIHSLGVAAESVKQAFKDRIVYARDNTTDILKKVWAYVIVAIAIGGFIHGYVPEDFLVTYAGPQNLFGVPIAVALGADPATILGAVTPVPDSLSEYQFAGLLRGGRTEVTRCLGSDLSVPATAEIGCVPVCAPD